MNVETFYPVDCISWMQQHAYELDCKNASYVVATHPDGWTITELTAA